MTGHAAAEHDTPIWEDDEMDVTAANTPVPPTNARLLVDDEVIPLELVYDGLDGWGRHNWKAPVPLHLSPARSVKLAYDACPDDANITVAWGMDGVEFDPRWRQ